MISSNRNNPHTTENADNAAGTLLVPASVIICLGILAPAYDRAQSFG
jgi:hypothetical protein